MPESGKEPIVLSPRSAVSPRPEQDRKGPHVLRKLREHPSRREWLVDMRDAPEITGICRLIPASTLLDDYDQYNHLGAPRDMSYVDFVGQRCSCGQFDLRSGTRFRT